MTNEATITTMRQESTHDAQQPDWVDAFRQMMAIICCLFGLPGNLLTIIVAIKALCQRTMNFERKVFDLYLVEISILDTFLLVYWVVETLVVHLYSTGKIQSSSPIQFSAFACYFFYLANRLCVALCSWLIMCFTLIRFMNIFRQWNTIRSNIILVTVLTVVLSIANSYHIVMLQYTPESKQDIQTNEQTISNNNNSNYSSQQSNCGIGEKYTNDSLILLLNTLVTGVLNLALPSILTLIVNIAILCFIKRIYNNNNNNGQCQGNRRSDSLVPHYRSTRSTLLVISIAYTLCYIPYCTVYFLWLIFEDNTKTIERWSKITFALRYVSHSINFYAYIFTNLRFRRDIILLLRLFFRSCLYMKQQYQRKAHQRRQEKHQKQTTLRTWQISTPVPKSIQSNVIGKCQRPTRIRFLNQADLRQQKAILDHIGNNSTPNPRHIRHFDRSAENGLGIKHQSAAFAMITPSSSLDNFSHKNIGVDNRLFFFLVRTIK